MLYLLASKRVYTEYVQGRLYEQFFQGGEVAGPRRPPPIYISTEIRYERLYPCNKK